MMKTAPPAATTIMVLCDDALAEILVRLPSKSVLRCGAVCKAWRRIASDPSFLAAHAAASALEMIMHPRLVYSEVRAMALYRDKPPNWRSRFLFDPNQRDVDFLHPHRVKYSLDGLLVLWQHPSRCVICNPTTRRSITLPVLTPDPCFNVIPCGFYHHGPSDEYRLLCHCLEKELRPGATGPYEMWDRERRFYVLSTAGGASRRLQGRAPAPTRRPYIMTEYGVPVAHRLSLHWFSVHPEAHATGKMLAFHTVSETFRLMSRPPAGRATDRSRALFELDDGNEKKLAVVAMQSETSLEVWVLQDYEAEMWTLHHRVEDLLPPLIDPTGPLAMTAVIPVGSGAVLMGDPCRRVPRFYSLKEKRMHRDVCIGPVSLTFLPFRESLVSHAFFDSPRFPEHTPITFTEHKKGLMYY